MHRDVIKYFFHCGWYSIKFSCLLLTKEFILYLTFMYHRLLTLFLFKMKKLFCFVVSPLSDKLSFGGNCHSVICFGSLWLKELICSMIVEAGAIADWSHFNSQARWLAEEFLYQWELRLVSKQVEMKLCCQAQFSLLEAPSWNLQRWIWDRG